MLGGTSRIGGRHTNPTPRVVVMGGLERIGGTRANPTPRGRAGGMVHRREIHKPWGGIKPQMKTQEAMGE